MKTELLSIFLMVDIRPIRFYLGLKIEQNHQKKTIKLSQYAYIKKILAKFHLDKAYLVNKSIKDQTLFEQETDKKAFLSK